ncbi:MAG: hypothetical protein JSR48_10090 [Verrucomicrobia bacterium]|nr:hypothetical protein [Verrucomicrobiota bacterium]
MVRLLAIFSCLLLACPAFGSEDLDLSRYDTVEIPSVDTSIYIGSVTLTIPTLTRRHHVYSSTYTARVFPYFFYNESGRIAIEVTDDMLRRLAAGQAVEFDGHALSSQGEERRITGRATPSDDRSGKIKVRVHVSKRIELIFNTTYRFPR